MPAQAWVTLLVGGVAAIGVIVTWQQKNRADRRSEWWRRSAWAFERSFSERDNRRRLGRQVQELADMDLPGYPRRPPRELSRWRRFVSALLVDRL